MSVEQAPEYREYRDEHGKLASVERLPARRSAQKILVTKAYPCRTCEEVIEPLDDAWWIWRYGLVCKPCLEKYRERRDKMTSERRNAASTFRPVPSCLKWH
jgi:hypothetical protein